MAEYLHQIIFCSERERRAFQREITVTARNAMVTGVEKLPRNYDMALAHMRDQNEEVSRYTGRIEEPGDTNLCPYCGNPSFFICNCGVLSCSVGTKKTHICPGCQKVCETKKAGYQPMSKSGFIHGGQGRGSLPPDRMNVSLPGRSGQKHLPERVPRPLELPAPEKADAKARLQKYLLDQKKPAGKGGDES